MNQDLLAGAWRLEGRTLGSGWRVVGAVGWDPKSGQPMDSYGSGGQFSKAYEVEKNGKKAFLKAIDLTRPLQQQEVMSALHQVTSEHKFEVDILKLCAGARMDRVVVAVDSGEERIGPLPLDIVPYLIFELAEGDVRKKIRTIDVHLKRAWWLRALHHASVGLHQLHAKRITHQDIKPSNILSYGGARGFKIGDLGRSTCEDQPGPFDKVLFPGDRSYAPPEILYGGASGEQFERRLCYDCYMLGSMIFFFGTGSGATQLFLQSLPIENRPASLGGGWMGNYSTILPLLQNSFTDMLSNLSDMLGDNQTSKELVKCASQLCYPDSRLRGHPITRSNGGRIYSLERYVSIFDRLANVAAIESRSRKRDD